MLCIFLEYLLVIYLRYLYKRELCFSLMHVVVTYSSGLLKGAVFLIWLLR